MVENIVDLQQKRKSRNLNCKKHIMKICNSCGQRNYRRMTVLARLEKQLTDGTKEIDGILIPLSELDKKRILKEIEVLRSRITLPEMARTTRTFNKKSSSRIKSRRN